MKRLTAALLGLLLVAAMVAGCSQSSTTDSGTTDSTTPKGPITVGSKIDVEGPVLGQIMIKMLESDGFDVVDQTRTGATDVVRNALLSGEIDAYPEYTANALTVFYADQEIDPAILKDAQLTYEKAAQLDLDNENIVWLQPAPANNTWAVAIPASLSESDGITSLADWADYVNTGGDVKVVGSQEFFDRADAMPAFEEAYGFTLSPDQIVTLATGDTAVTEKAAAEGTDGANAAMAYGTDGTISALNLVVLDDPLGVQPIYQPAPIFRGEVIDQYPEIRDLLDPVFAKLDLTTLQSLNAQVAIDGKDPATVADQWLKDEGFIQ